MKFHSCKLSVFAQPFNTGALNIKKKVSPLIPVQIKSIHDPSVVICTLVLRDGARIEFHDGAFVKDLTGVVMIVVAS